LLALLPTRRLRKPFQVIVLFAAACLMVARCSYGQRSHDPLTPNEEEQVRAVADQPNERVKLYIKFIEDRTEAIHHAVVRPPTQHPGAAIHDNLEDFTRLVDELQDNLDAYDESHTDVRKSLKYLLEHTSKWPPVLDEPPGSPAYDFVRKSALDAVENMKQSSTTLLKSQEEYFGKHKAEAEPKKKSDD
jgi:hypothetical protein